MPVPSPAETAMATPPSTVSPLRMWVALVALATAALLAATPFLLPLLKEVVAGRRIPLPLGVLLALQDLQALVLVSGAAAVGAWTAPRVGLDAPLIRARLGGERVGRRVLAIFPGSVLAGTLGAAAVLLFSMAMKSRLPAGTGDFPRMSPWVSATAALYGGVVEELLTRWGLLGLFAFVLDRVGVGRRTGFWVANVAAALAFGLLHLPGARALHMSLTPLVVVYLLVGNALVGLLCGWLFRSRGLESAMLGHATADLWLHTVFPAVGL